MLDRHLYLKVLLTALLADDDFTKAGTLQSCSHLMLTSSWWDMAKDMAEVLEIIEVATTQLSGEQYPTISLVLPLVYGLGNQLASSNSDCRLVADFKAILREQPTWRFSLEKPHPSSLPLLCTALDP